MTLDIQAPDPQLECEHCSKRFVKPKSLLVHVCEQKKRAQSINESGGRIGFMAFEKFFKTIQPSRSKTFAEFIKSPYYGAFVKFGWYVSSTRVINPAAFVDWLLAHNKKVDRWCSDKLYTEYLHEWLRVEAVEDALERAIKYAIEWAEEHNTNFADLLRSAGTGTLAMAVVHGRISPWVLYSCDTGQALLERFSPEQVQMVWAVIDPDWWSRRLRESPREWTKAKTVLAEAGW